MIEIALVDGTKFHVDYSLNEFVEDMPVPGWTYINEGDDKPKRYFNPANVAYVIEVPDGGEDSYEDRGVIVLDEDDQTGRVVDGERIPDS